MSGPSFIYHSPTTPGNPGFSVDLTDIAAQQGVRLGDLGGLVTEAELGAVGASSLRLDDPTGTAGHAGDAIVGLKQLSVNEGRAPSGNRRIGEFYITDRRYYRGGQGVSPSLRTGAARVIDMSLADINSFLHFRVVRTGTANGSNTTFNRPAETDVQRVTALLAVPFLSDTLFDGLVSTSNPVNMDAVDYSGQTPGDVLNDCAQQSGKNYFVFYDESGTYAPNPGDYALFYDSNDSLTYPAAVSATQVSNVLADISAGGTGPVWYPLEDGQLVRDPSRVVSGVLFQNGSNSVYETNVTTSYAYGWRDAVASSQNLKTVAQTEARANRYLAENATEDDRLTFTLKLPAAHVNDWKEGQYAQVKFTHLPDYGAFRNVRCLQRTVSADEMTDEFYNVRYECTPMVSPPSGAFDTQFKGVAYSGQPTLPTSTVAGDLLLLVLQGTGNTTDFPAAFRMKNNPSVSPASPEVPPFPTTDGWTVIETACTDYSGQNIGGPCGEGYQGPFHGTFPNPSCTGGIRVGVAWRRVLAGEESTVPVAVSTEITDASCSAWLYNLGNVADPSGAAVEKDAQESGHSVTSTLPTLSGNIVGIIGWATASGHTAVLQPTALTANSGSTLVQANANVNNQDLPTPANTQNWVGVFQRAGGIIAGSITVDASYAALNWCGVAVEIPASITLPTIPFPANHT